MFVLNGDIRNKPLHIIGTDRKGTVTILQVEVAESLTFRFHPFRGMRFQLFDQFRNR